MAALIGAAMLTLVNHNVGDEIGWARAVVDVCCDCLQLIYQPEIFPFDAQLFGDRSANSATAFYIVFLLNSAMKRFVFMLNHRIQ